MSDDRRRSERVTGPFDGYRVGALETPVRIYDLSEGGCFINSLHETASGQQIVLKIHLPYEGWITVKAETLYGRPGFGFAVRFSELTEETRACLERVLKKLQERLPHEE